MFNDTIFMCLSVDLLMRFVEMFAEWFYHVVEFLLLWPQVKELKNLTIIQSQLFVLSLNRKDFLQCNCEIPAITLLTSYVRVYIVFTRNNLYVRSC